MIKKQMNLGYAVAMMQRVLRGKSRIEQVLIVMGTGAAVVALSFVPVILLDTFLG